MRNISLLIKWKGRPPIFFPRPVLQVEVNSGLRARGDGHAIVVEQPEDYIGRRPGWNGKIGNAAVRRVVSSFMGKVMRRDGAEKLRLQDFIDLGDQASGPAGAFALGLGEALGS